MDQRAYWMGFDQVRGVGSVTTKKLLDHFGDLSLAWASDKQELIQAGLSDKIVQNLLSTRKTIDLISEWEKIEQNNIEVITFNQESYPENLKNIEHPPPVLYLKGDVIDDDVYAVAVVGTRRKTSYGERIARTLGEFLAANTITVVSGMARGIDTIAHQSSIRSGGRTLAVLGCGVDVTYPPENKKLSAEIIQNGALVSEYYPGTIPDAKNFPPRNRLIAGLSRIVIVVEAGEKSGALITARFGVEQSKDVFAVPGSIYAPRSMGTNQLIHKGAIPLIDFHDILLALNMKQTAEFRYVQKVLPESDLEKKIIDVLQDEAVQIDEIQASVGASAETVSSTLVMMELKGMIKQIENMRYQTIADGQIQWEVE